MVGREPSGFSGWVEYVGAIESVMGDSRRAPSTMRVDIAGSLNVKVITIGMGDYTCERSTMQTDRLAYVTTRKVELGIGDSTRNKFAAALCQFVKYIEIGLHLKSWQPTGDDLTWFTY